ncbi:hypothetical protein SH449x_003706 [Pirellulaceae bacterium SH449]
MLSPETLETYRQMTPGERLRITFQLMQGCDQALLSGSAEQVFRKFELLHRENDLRNENMLQAIARTR